LAEKLTAAGTALTVSAAMTAARATKLSLRLNCIAEEVEVDLRNELLKSEVEGSVVRPLYLPIPCLRIKHCIM
jgi:hypothetical protein